MPAGAHLKPPSTASQVPKRLLGGAQSDVVVSFDFLPQIGGAHLWLYEVYRRWGSQVEVLTRQYSPAPAEAEAEREFDRGPHGALRIHRRARPVAAIDLLDPGCLRSFGSHVLAIGRLAGQPVTRVHALRAFPEGFAALLYKTLHPRSCRLITYAHGEEVLIARTSRQLKLMAKRVYAASNLVIANSENTRRVVKDLCPSAKVVCIHPGVDAAAFARDEGSGAAYRNQLPWPAGTVVVCTVARMEARKNQATVIRAIGDLRKQGLPIAYVCGGDGPERGRLERLATESGVREWVSFPGRMSESDKRQVHWAADIYAMPSVQVGEMIEGFGIVFLEAAASGLPSVCGNNGGQSEAVLDGSTGVMVDGSDHRAVAAAISKLARDPALRASMGRAGQEWAAQHDWSNIVRRTLTELDRLDCA